MNQTVQAKLPSFDLPDYLQAWEMVSGELRGEISGADFDTWIKAMQPLGYQDGIYLVGVFSSFAKEWVESRYKSRITQLLRGVFRENLTVEVRVISELHGVEASTPAPLPSVAAEPAGEKEKRKPRERKEPESSPRKISLQKAYGSERASLIQPDRTLYVTLYFMLNWLPLIGHSAFATILAARSMCYWNPMTGELRNRIQTDMSELAARASVSVRTVKDVLSNELVQRYFLRYNVRRVMTENGVRTAGIVLLVRMDDPLTPEDQAAHNLPEEDHWYSAEFEGEEEE